MENELTVTNKRTKKQKANQKETSVSGKSNKMAGANLKVQQGNAQCGFVM
jgi:hypothetical protein